MSFNKVRGGFAVLYNTTDKTKKVGAEVLTAHTWYRIEAVDGTAPAFDAAFKVKNIFKEGAAPITLAADDIAWELEMTELCRGDCDVSLTKGVVEATDSCDDGFSVNVSDGYTQVSGSISGYLRISDSEGIAAAQQLMLRKYFDIFTDNAAGTYVKNAKNDDELILSILHDSTNTATANKAVWLYLPVHLTDCTLGKPLRGVQSFDISFALGQKIIPSLYIRTQEA